MADTKQEYPDVTLVVDRGDNGEITNLEYTVNNAGEDGKRIIEFIQMLVILCHDTVLAGKIDSENHKL